VEEALDKRTSMGVIGNLNQYTQFQAANAMEKAAENEGMAGGGMAMGMGFAMANQMGQSMNQKPMPPQGQAPPGPPPLPDQKMYHVAVGGQQSGPYDLGTVKQQIQNGRITKDTLVWSEGMANWAKAGDVPEIAPSFSSVPPPLPPE